MVSNCISLKFPSISRLLKEEILLKSFLWLNVDLAEKLSASVLFHVMVITNAKLDDDGNLRFTKPLSDSVLEQVCSSAR